MTPELTVAAVQLTSTQDVDANLSRSLELTRAAAEAGARLIALPENYGFLGPDADKLKHAQNVEDGPFTAALRELAREHDVYVLAGSIPETGPDARHTFNTSVLIGPDGATVSTYRKIHMFDVELADGTSLKESDSVAAVQGPVLTEIDGWKVGLTICYDLRFPELYRELKRRNVQAVFHSFHNGYQKKAGIHAKIMRQTVQGHAGVNYMWVSMNNSSGYYSSWPSVLIQPDGAIAASLPANRAGLMLNTIDTTRSYYDASAPFRARAIRGVLHSGTLVSDARQKSTRCL